MKTLSTLHGLVKMSEAQFLPQGSIRDTNSLDHQRGPIGPVLSITAKKQQQLNPSDILWGVAGT